MPTEKKPHVLILSQYFWPEENTTSWLLSTLAFELSKRGYRVSALAGQPSYRAAEKIPAILEEQGVTIERVYSTRLDKNTILGRVLNTVTFVLAVFWRLLLKRDVDVILPVTNPPILCWIVRFHRLLKGTPYVLLIHDLYPQIVVALGRTKEGSLLERTWTVLSRWSYRGASRIVSLGRCMTEVMRKELPSDQSDKIVTIPNWDDGDLLIPRPREGHPLIQEWGLEDRFVLLYAGNIGLFHEIRTVLEAAERLADTPAHFVFIGDGGQASLVREAAESGSAVNVTLLPYQPKREMDLVLTACDMSLITLKREATGLCVPSKLYGVLACGKPIAGVLPRESETARAIEEEGCGLVVEPGAVDEFTEGIRGLMNAPDRLREMGENGRSAFENKYTLGTIVEAYAKTFDAILRP